MNNTVDGAFEGGIVVWNLAGEPTVAATERQPGDAGGGVDADRSRQAMGLGGCIEVGQRGAALGGGSLRLRVDLHGGHLRQVDDNAVIAE